MEVVFTARGHSAMYWVVFLRQCIPPRGLSVWNGCQVARMVMVESRFLNGMYS